MDEVALQAMYNNIPAGLRSKYRQAVAARTGEWSTGSSSSSGEEDKKSKIQEAETEELRAQVEQLKLDEQRKRLQRQLWEVERFTDVPLDVQSSIKEILQQGTLSTRGMIFCRRA